jgi:hypothetical protein
MKMATIILAFLDGDTLIDHESLWMLQSTQAVTICDFEMLHDGVFAMFAGSDKTRLTAVGVDSELINSHGV